MFAPQSSVYFQVIPSGNIPTCYLPVCRYGSSCYRKNPEHFTKFLHPSGSTEFEESDCFIKMNETSSLKELYYQVTSIYDCTNTKFTMYVDSDLHDDWIKLDRSIFYALLQQSAFTHEKFNLYVEFTTKKNVFPSPFQFGSSQWRAIRCCAKCQRSIYDAYYFECSNCLPSESYVLCSFCEQNHSHNREHIFAKIYPHQQGKQPRAQQPKNDEKLDEIVDALSSLQLQVQGQQEMSKIKKEQNVPAVPQSQHSDAQRDLHKQTLKELVGMGFKPSAELCNTIIEKKGDISAVLAELLD